MLPAFALVYLIAGPPTLGAAPHRRSSWRRRGADRRRPAGGSRSSSSWPASAGPTSAARRTTACSNLIFGYNGFGRLTGNETGSVGGGGRRRPGGWGATGLAAACSTPSSAARSRGCCRPRWSCSSPASPSRCARPRTDRTRAALVLWGGWLVVTGVVVQPRQGIIHPYYTVALAPGDRRARRHRWRRLLWHAGARLWPGRAARRAIARDRVLGVRAARAHAAGTPAAVRS